MSDSGAGRGRVPLLLILGIPLLFIISLAVYFFNWSSSARSSLPGEDVSRFHPSAVPGHIEALKSADPTVRRQAAITLWQIGDAGKEATPALIQAARDADPEVRTAAVKALGRTGQDSQDAIAALIEGFQDTHTEVRVAAAVSLAEAWRIAGKGASEGRRGPGGPGGGQARAGAASTSLQGELLPAYEPLARKAIPLLAAALHDGDVRIRTHAAEALAETGRLAEPVVPDLVHLLETDSDPDARLQATLALSSIGPGAKAAVPVLVGKLRTEKADGVRVNTANALGLIRSNPETVVPALVETFLNDEHPDARRCAMASIGRFGPDAKIAIVVLEKAAKDPANAQSPQKLRNINSLLEYVQNAARESPKDGRGKGSHASPAETGPPTKRRPSLSRARSAAE
jgi:HEAT repeat protein